jgi:hypothetical protein
MNFAFLAFVDVFDFAASLRPRLGLLKGGRLVIRGPRKDAADPDDDLAFVMAKEAARWPELKTTLSHVERLGDKAGGVDFGRIHLEMLMPGQTLPWSHETTPYAEMFQRAHLALRTNPGAALFSGNEAWHVPTGHVVAINRRAPCSAINMGEHSRIHLIIDFKIRPAKESS